jgi:sarcosine oxidase subunit beta
VASSNVIIVGAGVNGCSIAFHLARAGARVTVFDMRDVCAGMSARSGALVRMHYTFAPEAALAWKSLAYFENWRALVGSGACGFVRTGFVLVVGPENAGALRLNVEMLRSLGIDTELCDPAQLARVEPALRTDDVALAAFEPRSGYADPVATTRAFADAARKLGAGFELGVAVASIAVRGGRAVGVLDAAGRRHDSDSVVVVAGPWTDRLLAPLGVSLGLRAERAQIAFLRRPPALRHCACIDLVAASYFRPHGDDLTLVGMGQWKTEDAADADNFDPNNNSDFIAEARARIVRRIPALSGAPYSHGHAGIYDVSPDQRAVLGAIRDVPGLYVAAGFSGTGFKTSPAVGAAMAELILDGASRTADLTPFRFERLHAREFIRSPHEYAVGSDFGHSI